MAEFKKVSKYKDSEVVIPEAATRDSAGYDLSVAGNDILVPSLLQKYEEWKIEVSTKNIWNPVNLKDLQENIEEYGLRPVLVPTGVKIKLDPNQYLSLSARSSLPLKSLLVVANAPGIIDADYYDNPHNEGEIFIQLLNLSPYDVYLTKGDRIAQGVILKYDVIEGARTIEERSSGHGSTGV